MKTSSNDIAVIGMSCVFPGAKDLASYWENIISKKSGISVAPESRVPHLFFDPEANSIDRHSVNKGGFVDEYLEFDPIEFGMVPNSIQGTEAEHLVALKLAKLALEDAGIFEKKLSLENAGIIIGKGSFGGRESYKLNEIVDGGENISRLLRTFCPQLNEADILRVKQAYQQQIGTFNAQNIMGVVPNLTASLIANRFNCGGPAYTVDAACASSLLGIENGMRELQSGRCDIVIVGAIHLLQCPSMFSFFQTLGALSKQQEVRPFDQHADGILTGEGCGFIVLKRLQDAIADGHRIYSVIKGIGISSDGSHASVMSPSSVGQVKAIDRAWDMAGYSERHLGYLEAHGTGTVLGDETELQTLITAFPRIDGAQKAGLGAVKALIGHAMAAAGMAGFIKTVMALYKGIIPPTINCSEPLAAMHESHFQPVTEPLSWEQSGLPRRAGVNAFGFGGANAHVILEHYENPPFNLASVEENSVVLLARDSAAELIAAVTNKESHIGEGKFRIALFNPTEKRRELAVRIIQKGVEWKDRQDVWFSSEPLLKGSGDKLAFLFPGLDVPAINGINDADIAQLAAYLSVELSDNLLKSTRENYERKLEDFQIMIDAALKQLGVKPDAISGHSLGEWTAGRSISLLNKDVMHKMHESLSSKEHPAINAGFLSVNCGITKLQEYLQDETEVYISNDNCHQQVVVSARPEHILRFQEKLLAGGITSHLLPFETGYHTPFADIYVAGVCDALNSLVDVGLPQIPIWSCISASKYETQIDIAIIKQSIADFITHPVQFRALIENMYGDGVRAFIQIGEGALTGFVSNILHGKRFSIIASSHSKRGTLAQLQRVVAALFVDGRTANLSILNIANGNKKNSAKPRSMASKIDIQTALIDVEQIIDQDILNKLMPAASTDNDNIEINDKIFNVFKQNLAQINQAQEAFLNMLGSSGTFSRPSVAQQSSVVRTNIKKNIDFSLASFPYLIDHCPFRKRSITQNFDHEQQPIVPFTLFIDVVTEFFLASFPSLQVARVTSVKVHQFLWLEENRRLELKGEWQTENAIKFFIDDVFEATIHTDSNAASVFNPPVIQAKDLQPPVLAVEIYSQGYMFHGPLYQGIKDIVRFTEKSLETSVTGNAIKGAMLDNMGQTVGLMNHFLGNSLRSFPVGVEQIDFYQNPLDQLGDFHCRAYTTSEDENFYYSTIELTRDQQPWCKFTGWKTKKSDLDDTGWSLLSKIEGKHLSRRLGDGLFVLEGTRYKQANTWLIMAEIYLNNAENLFYKQLPVAKQREYLCRAIAAKDAIRDVILNAQGRVMHPASFVIDNNESSIFAVSYGDNIINTSIATAKNCTVALAGNHQELVVDIGEIRQTESNPTDNFLSQEEKNLKPNLCNTDEWVARIQTAKAVYKKYLNTQCVNTDSNNSVHTASGFDLHIHQKIIRTVKYKQYIIGWII